MGKKYALLSTAMLLVALCLFGCSGSNSKATENDVVSDQSSEDLSKYALVAGTEEQTDSALTLEEVGETTDKLFMGKDDSFYPVENVSYSEEGGLVSKPYYAHKSDATSIDDTPVFHLSQGCSLVTTCGDRWAYAFYPVTEEGYCLGRGDDNLKVYDEIDGVDIQESKDKQQAAEDVLAEKGIVYQRYVYTSSSPTSFTVGRYVGTKFQEDTWEIDVPYLFIGEDPTVCRLSQTKEGYFNVDTSTLTPGTYLVCWRTGSEKASWQTSSVGFRMVVE